MNDLAKLMEQIKHLSAESHTQLAHYITFLQWQEAQNQARDIKSWSFSFIESFREAAVSASQSPAGMDIKMAPATVGNIDRPALWAHPPVTGQAVIEYHVPIPQQVYNLQLRLAIGIRDGAKITDNNLVAFSVRANGMRVWGQQTNTQVWQEVEIPLDLLTGDITRIEFITEALGSHQWTWAVWGTPELSGKIRESTSSSTA